MKHAEVSILMTARNPKGHKLEDLLRTLANEIDAKTAHIVANTEAAAQNYRRTNDEVAAMLRKAAGMQEAAIDFALANPFTPRSA